MAIIDLGSGEVERSEEDLNPVGRIIDVETGEFKEPSVEMATEATPDPQAEQSKESSSVGDFFTGSQRIEQTPELGTLPEFGATDEGDTFKIAMGMLSTFDPKAQLDIIQQQIPEAVFETTQDGSTIIEVPTESGGVRRSVLNRPGASPQDFTTGIAKALSFVPAARLAGMGKSLLQKFGMGAAGAGATEQLSQEGGMLLGRQERDPVETAIAAGTGGAAEVLVPAIQGVRAASQARQVGAAADELEQVAGSVTTAREATEETGIPLFQAQQTGVPAQLEKQSFVAQLPAGTQASMKGLKAQNQAAGDAVEDFLGQIAPDSAVVTGAEKLRTAAQNAVERVKTIRSEKASPFYEEAFEEAVTVDIAPVKSLISGKLKELPKTGEIAKTIKKVESLISGNSGLKNLHNAKIEIDQMINKVGEGSLGNATKANLIELQEALLRQMDDSSELYGQARQAFAEASPAVTKIQDSIVGKVANLKDDQLKQVTSKLFDPAQTNPKVILDAKKTIQDVDPNAWNEIVRTELERRLGSIKSSAESGTVENIPGQLYRALFPNNKGTKVLMNALDDEGKKNLRFLQTALKRASLGRPGGSQTAGRTEIVKELKGGFINGVRNLFRTPINTLVSTGEDAMFNSKVSALSKALYDPTWKAEMTKLRKFNPDSPASARAFTQLINDIESTQPESKESQ